MGKNIERNDEIAKYSSILVIIQAVLMIICLFYISSFDPFVYLNENQILYFFSTAAQVIAGLYGLTITAYIFFNDKLNNIVLNDETLYDTIAELKSKYYGMLLALGGMCVLSIIFCLIIISSVNIQNELLNYFLINQTTIFIVTEIVLIVLFSCKVIDPKQIDKMNEILLSRNDFNKEEKGDLGDFLKFYNKLEGLIVETSNSIINANKYNMIEEKKFREKYRPSILHALKVLVGQQILSKQLVAEIDEIRRYRNFTVHVETVVSKEACRRIEEIYNEVEKILNEKNKKNAS